MSDRNFDQLLYQGADALPTQELPAAPPEPWRQPMGLLCWGFALCSITLNFWRLNYLLPAIGVVLLWLGFRMLRRENGPFRAAYLLSTATAVYRLLSYVLQATPLAPQLDNIGYGLVGSLLHWLLYLALWRGLKQVFYKADQPPQTGAAGALVFWYAVICLLALVNLQGLPVLVLLILWVIILICLFRTGRSLDGCGYAVTPAPVRLSNRWAAAIWLGVSAAALILCMVSFQRLPMENISAAELPADRQTELREELAELGFPRDLLADLSDEEVALLEGATLVDREDSTARDAHGKDTDRLSTRLIMVVLPNDLLRFYYQFIWETPPDHRLMDSIRIHPTMQHSILSYPTDSLARGRLLWEENGTTLQMPLSGTPTYGTFRTGLFYSTPPGQQFTVSFSLPEEGTRLRGYLTWTAHPTKPAYMLNFNADTYYIHQSTLLNYPWTTPVAYHEQGGRGNTDPFFPREQHLVLFQYPGK